ncbi:MAG: ABC transporter ATP-binding protein [Ruminococcus sp.]|nr:ABC transporter ATP-binding protein [Ruminococcus sp.]
MAQLVCENLVLGYEGKSVVEHLSFSVEAGEYWYIIGENGSGKSTLVKALLRRNPPLSGTITFDENIRKEIGYLPQQTAVQRDFPATVREVVSSGCLGKNGFSPFYSRRSRQTIQENMKRLGIADLAKRSYRELSGGQQQRVLLTRALCAAKKMLLLDEPVTGLDPQAQAELYELIQSLNQKDGMTILMISHDVEAAVRYATHILHIGKTPLFIGAKADYLNSEPGKAFLQNRMTYQKG